MSETIEFHRNSQNVISKITVNGRSYALEMINLIDAVRSDNQEEIDLFLKDFRIFEWDIDVEYEDYQEGTALHYACLCNKNESILKLVLKGADVNAVNDFGDTPCSFVVKANNLEMLKFLVENGADVNAGNGKLLHYACFKNNVELVKYLIKLHVKISTVPVLSPLAEAVKKGYYEIAKLLLDYDLTCKTDTLAFMWIRSKDVEMFKLFISYGYNINMCDSDGNTHLHYACNKDDEEIIRNLLQFNPDSGIKNYNGQSPMDNAMFRKNIQDLLKNYQQPQTLMDAIKTNSIEVLKRFLDHCVGPIEIEHLQEAWSINPELFHLLVNFNIE